MNVLTKELNNGFNGYIVDDSKPKRVLQCRDCGSIEVHDQKFFSLHGRPCEGGCGCGKGTIQGHKVIERWDSKTDNQEDLLVALPIKCKNCGNQKGFNFPDDSGVEEAELAEHEMYASAKASMLKGIDKQNDNDDTEVLSELESEFAKITQLAENTPRIKGIVEQQVFTMEPQDGFDSSGFIEKDLYHKSNIHETAYAHLVNAGNTPHMQKKIPIDLIIAMRTSKAKAVVTAFTEDKTFGNRLINAECKSKMGFSVECDNQGDRKLSDRQVKASLTSIYFAQNKVKEIKEIQTSFKLSKDEVKELEQAEETIERLTAVLKTGNISSGHQSPMYESRDNTYDPVSLEKLQMELDIPWNETPMDIYQIAHSSKAKRKDNK